METPLEGTKDIAMAAEGKVWAEIERMFCLVGILQEHSTLMSEQLMTFNLELNNSVDDTKWMEKNSAAAEEKIILELGEKEEERGEEMQVEKTNQEPATFGNKGNKEDDQWITNLQKERKIKEEAPGITRISDYKKTDIYDWDFFFRLEYGRLIDPGQKLLLVDSERGKYEGWMAEPPREEKANKMDCQKNWWRETNWGLRASDVRNPG